MSIMPFKMKIIPAINAAAETVSGEKNIILIPTRIIIHDRITYDVQRT